LGLLLQDDSPSCDSLAARHVPDSKLDQIASPQLAVDGQIEQRKIADTVADLQPDADGPDVLELQG
jgi:hypothetical protein